MAIRNMLNLKMDVALIANIQNVDIPFIEQIQKEQEKEDIVKKHLKTGKLKISEIAEKEKVSEIFVEAMREDTGK